MGKKGFLKELGLSLEVVEPREARSEMTGDDSETEERKPSPPDEEHSDVLEAELEAPQLTKKLAEDKAMKDATGHDGGTEGNLRESAADEAIPDPIVLLGRKATDKPELTRTPLAAAATLPLSLLGSKKAWVWMLVLICVAIACYLLIKWHSGKSTSTSSLKQEPQSVEEFMKKHYRDALNPS